MGLYEIACPQCGAFHLWFSGKTNDQRCEACIKLAKKISWTMYEHGEVWGEKNGKDHEEEAESKTTKEKPNS